MKKISKSVSQTLKIGKILGKNLSGGEIILLSGTLGAGKTVLAKGIAQGLGIKIEEVISPTFVLLRVIKGKYNLHHFDLYRLNNPAQIQGLGFEEYFYADGVTLVEWPERLKLLLPKEFLKIKLIFQDRNSRLLEFVAQGARYKKLLARIDENIRN